MSLTTQTDTILCPLCYKESVWLFNSTNEESGGKAFKDLGQSGENEKLVTFNTFTLFSKEEIQCTCSIEGGAS